MPERAARRPAQVVDQHEVIADPFVRVEQDPIEHFDDGADVHDETRLFQDFARGARLERFADLERATRQAPLTGERLEPPFDEHDLSSTRITAPTPTIGRSG